MDLNAYRAMWIVVLFDLPVDSKDSRRRYAQFRKMLLADGFMRMQYSVYMRHVPSRENADVHLNRIEGAMVPDGEVRILTITDKQFERMRVFLGKQRRMPEHAPKQLEFF